VVGYFNQNVINLDGKIDSMALRSLKSGGVFSYIDAQKIDVLVDWPNKFRLEALNASAGDEWHLCSQQPRGLSICYERRVAAREKDTKQ